MIGPQPPRLRPLTCDVCNTTEYREKRQGCLSFVVTSESGVPKQDSFTVTNRICLKCGNDDPRKFSLRQEIG
jgi:hypothetical protein